MDQCPSPTGLNALCKSLDPYFVDGLFSYVIGGSIRKVRLFKAKPDTFWPTCLLPGEPEVSTSRILIFGHDPEIRSRGLIIYQSSREFARVLLFGTKFGKDGRYFFHP